VVVRLFRRTNSIRRTLEAQQERAGIDLRGGERSASLGPEATRTHAQLDVIEKQLALLQQRQQVLVERQAGMKKKGRVEPLDLRSVIESVDEDDAGTAPAVDDDFDQRFDLFAATTEIDDRARRWMDAP
jgi:hypothetical protein